MTKSERDRLVEKLTDKQQVAWHQDTFGTEWLRKNDVLAIICAGAVPEKCLDCGSEMIEVCSGLEAVCNQAAPAGDDVVERVAKALFDAANHKKLWSDVREGVRNNWRKKAKAAIAAYEHARKEGV